MGTMKTYSLFYISAENRVEGVQHDGEFKRPSRRANHPDVCLELRPCPNMSRLGKFLVSRFHAGSLFSLLNSVRRSAHHRAAILQFADRSRQQPVAAPASSLPSKKWNGNLLVPIRRYYSRGETQPLGKRFSRFSSLSLPIVTDPKTFVRRD